MAKRTSNVYVLQPGDEISLRAGWLIPTSGGMARVKDSGIDEVRLTMYNDGFLAECRYRIKDVEIKGGTGMLSLKNSPRKVEPASPEEKRSFLASGGLLT